MSVATIELTTSHIATLIAALEAYQTQPQLELTLASLVSLVSRLKEGNYDNLVQAAECDGMIFETLDQTGKRRVECQNLLHGLRIALKQQLYKENLEKAKAAASKPVCADVK